MNNKDYITLTRLINGERLRTKVYLEYVSDYYGSDSGNGSTVDIQGGPIEVAESPKEIKIQIQQLES